MLRCLHYWMWLSPHMCSYDGPLRGLSGPGVLSSWLAPERVQHQAQVSEWFTNYRARRWRQEFLQVYPVER